MTDHGRLRLYRAPEPEQVVGSRVDEIMERFANPSTMSPGS